MRQTIKRRRRSRQAAFSLLELVAVVAVIGILGAIAAVSLKRDTLVNYETRTAARTMALDMTAARRAAIATGDNHFLDFVSDAGGITGYTVTRRGTSGNTAVEASREFPEGLTVTLGAGEPEFDFLGEALAAYTVTLAGPQRTWTVTVVIATGAVRVSSS
jgi:prepilin-type N-terminal cleavage/methylation domain-containing protein